MKNLPGYTEDPELDELIDDILDYADYNKTLSRHHRKRLKAAILNLYISKEAVEKAIGEDEHLYDWENDAPRALEFNIRNQLRSEIRQSLGLGGSDERV